MMKRVPFSLIALVVALVGMGIVMTAFAADELDAIKKRGKLIVGVQPAAPPASMINAQGELEGFEVDLAKALAAELGVGLELKQTSDAIRIPSLLQGSVDLEVATLTHTRERDKQIDFSITYFMTGQRIMVRKGSPIKSVRDLTGKKVGTAKGSTSEQNLMRANPKARLVTFDDVSTAFLALKNKTVDAITTDESLLLSLKAGAEKPNDYEVVGEYFSKEPFGIGMRQGASDLRDFVNFTLMKLWETGKFKEIYNKWYGPNTKYALPLSFEMEVWP